MTFITREKKIIEINSESSDSENCDYAEIKIKNQTYILEGNYVFVKNKTGKKDEIYGIYSNGKVKKITSKEIDI